MDCFVTDSSRRMERVGLRSRVVLGAPEMQLVKVYPRHLHQRIIGFGGAITEASGYVYSLMDAEARERFIRMHFGEGGARYSLCRLVIQSCDFSLAPRAYVDDARDRGLSGFSIEADRRYVLPLVHDALAANPRLEFLASPWSPPAWAKTNRTMLFGGHLRRRYYGRWARIIARYMAAYRSEGVPVTRITVQNEPQARQVWESCLFTPKQELRLARELRSALDEAGLDDVRILGWDHNKEGLLERTETLACGKNPGVDGMAFHWYSGDHFEAVRAARELLGPERELVFSEGCDAYSAGDPGRELPHAEHYAHEVIGDLEAGANAVLDWNMLLDAQGGPTHVGNFCDAPVMYDAVLGELNVRLPHWYLSHFSRFIQPGAQRMLTTRCTADLETTAFSNPDGTHALVVLNRRDWPWDFDLQVAGTRIARLTRVHSPAHSIMTIVW